MRALVCRQWGHMSVEDLAQLCGVTRGDVRHHARKLGLYRPSRSDGERRSLVRQALLVMPPRKVAWLMDVSDSMVRDAARGRRIPSMEERARRWQTALLCRRRGAALAEAAKAIGVSQDFAAWMLEVVGDAVLRQGRPSPRLASGALNAATISAAAERVRGRQECIRGRQESAGRDKDWPPISWTNDDVVWCSGFMTDAELREAFLIPPQTSLTSMGVTRDSGEMVKRRDAVVRRMHGDGPADSLRYDDAARVSKLARSGMTPLAISRRLGLPLAPVAHVCQTARRKQDKDEHSEHSSLDADEYAFGGYELRRVYDEDEHGWSDDMVARASARQQECVACGEEPYLGDVIAPLGARAL